MRLPRARRIPTAIRVNHPPGPERAADPGRLGANRRPRPERAADPGQLGANRRPGTEPVAGSPRREASAHPKERKSRSHISTSAIVCASTTPATSTILSRDMVRGCSVIAYIGRRRTSSGPRLPSQTLRTDGFARTASRGRRRANASESGCPRRRRRATSIYGTKPSRLWFSAKCRQITPTAHPLSGPIRSELGPKVTGLPRPRC